MKLNVGLEVKKWLHVELSQNGTYSQMDQNWRTVPWLDRLAFPLLFIAAVLSAGTEYFGAGLSLSFFLLASVAALFGLVWKPQPALSAA